MTPKQKTRMIHQEDLEVCTVGGNPVYGSLNSYEAGRLEHGDMVSYAKRNGETGTGVVDYLSFYDGMYVQLTNGTPLWPEYDLIENSTHGESCTTAIKNEKP